MHADLLAAPGARARRSPRSTTPYAPAARAVARAAAASRRGERRGAARRAGRRRRRDLHVHRHARGPDRRRRRGGQGDLLREAGLARPGRGRPRAGRGARRPACRSRSASTAASIPAHAAVARAVAERRDRRAADRAHHQPRPGAAADRRTSAGSGGHLPRHDDPRLRHGALRRSAARSSRSTRAARCAIDPAFGEAGDVDTAVDHCSSTTNGCLTTIDNSRQAVYGYDQRVEVFGSRGHGGVGEPARAQRRRAHRRRARRAATLPYFFLERYIPSYLREWEAFVAAVPGTPPVVGGADARAPLVIGLAAWRSLREGRTVRIGEPASRSARPLPPAGRVQGPRRVIA